MSAIWDELEIARHRFARQTGPKTPAQIVATDLPQLYPLQAQIVAEAGRFNVLDIGRRAGKTYLGTRLAIDCALAGHPVGWFAPSYKFVLEVWRDLTRPLHKLKCRINATERRIEIPNAGTIEVWTLENPDAGRGRKYKVAIVDEAAMAPHLKLSWEEAIRPTLTDLSGSAWFLSTPKGLNYFYDLYQRGQDRERHPDWRCWQLPSAVNPFLPPAEIEAARRELPELTFRQEYEAQFLQNEGAVFRNVDACLTSMHTSPGQHDGHTIVAGVDWAKQYDFTAISLICCDCVAEVALDRFNQIGWELQRGRLAALVDKWNVRQVLVEKNSIGGPLLESLQSELPDKVSVGGFETTAKSKPKLIQSLALCLEKEHMRFLPDPIARHELVAYEATVTDSGHTKYSAPEGQHDDTVIARALAWKLARVWLPIPLPEHIQEDNRLPADYRMQLVTPEQANNDGWHAAREWRLSQARKKQAAMNADIHDPFSNWTPGSGAAHDGDPFGGE